MFIWIFPVDSNAVWSKNAPLIYQQVINNCLWGFVRLPPEEEAEIDQEVLDYLNLDPQHDGPPGVNWLRGRPYFSVDTDPGGPNDSVQEEHPCSDADVTCLRAQFIYRRYRTWRADVECINISVSLPKSEFGKLSIPYLSHAISAEGIRATPKIAKGVQDLPFPTTMKGVHSFLGILNYYHKFIEDYPVIAASLYELSDDQDKASVLNPETQDCVDPSIEAL
ncbi:hypothetical protein PHMEG_00021293 [Phytophthora megakarya]|uniref:Reverse transcriptase n=1 Tax=Phytophthora megakarya TaxID=4795 RepID=A0A225VN45_9STRA|nr:hypothetical protein PHMEG_00021293 [Phytophthora megakarya]